MNRLSDINPVQTVEGGRKVSALTLNLYNFKTVLLMATKLDDFS